MFNKTEDACKFNKFNLHVQILNISTTALGHLHTALNNRAPIGPDKSGYQ